MTITVPRHLTKTQRRKYVETYERVERSGLPPVVSRFVSYDMPPEYFGFVTEEHLARLFVRQSGPWPALGAVSFPRLPRRTAELAELSEDLHFGDEDFLRAHPPQGRRFDVAPERLASITITPPVDAQELERWTAELEHWTEYYVGLGTGIDLERLESAPIVAVLIPVDGLDALELGDRIVAIGHRSPGRRAGFASAALQAARDASIPLIPVALYYATLLPRSEINFNRANWWEQFA